MTKHLICQSIVVVTMFFLGAGYSHESIASTEEMTINVTGKVLNKTCKLNADPVLTLNTVLISDLDLTIPAKPKDMKVEISCGADVQQNIGITVDGTVSANTNAFKNTYAWGLTAKNVALLLQDESGNIVPPAGSVKGITPVPGQSMNYNFKAGYLATSDTPEIGGFETTLTLKVIYN